MQLEKDALEAASALIKKAKGVNLQKLANCEKAIIIDTLRDKYQIMRLKIREIFQDSGNTYGYRRLHAVLKRNYPKRWFVA